MAVTFGSFLREVRESRGIPLRQMANQIGIAPGYMSDIEKGRRNPPIGRLERIASVLRMTREEKETMYDLAGDARDEIPDDITAYVTFSAINDRAWSFQPFLPICTELTPSPQGGSRGPATYRVWAVVLQHSQCFHRLY